ncbi:hypothetical protein AURDEDRAFT_176570 [Auricularia subglabra TFB-10046 SS5]|uniref:SUN domain-containing protein n=1 Tax=Auricularia subglabra (strain TFB-10046 / SS5) TaxID=717982 RepID=J0LCW8_AURST|nr:hypothetical protein AURDEDRAFT_176570 [Auricularia subglabra TFB-10046 SS5]
MANVQREPSRNAPFCNARLMCGALLVLALGMLLGMSSTYYALRMPTTSGGHTEDTLQRQLSPLPERYEAEGPIELGSGSTPTFFDHAAFKNGGRIVDSLTSATLPGQIIDLYNATVSDNVVDILVRASSGPPSMPEVSIGLFSDPRALWFSTGHDGTLTVALSSPAIVRSLHLKPHLRNRACLPRDLNIWGLVMPPDAGRCKQSMFLWPPTGFPSSLQKANKFKLRRTKTYFQNRPVEPHWVPLGTPRGLRLDKSGAAVFAPSSLDEHGIYVHMIAVEFRANWGSAYTCFPGLAVQSVSK